MDVVRKVPGAPRKANPRMSRLTHSEKVNMLDYELRKRAERKKARMANTMKNSNKLRGNVNMPERVQERTKGIAVAPPMAPLKIAIPPRSKNINNNDYEENVWKIPNTVFNNPEIGNTNRSIVNNLRWTNKPSSNGGAGRKRKTMRGRKKNMH